MTRGEGAGRGRGLGDNMALLRIDLAFGKWKFKRNEKWFWASPPARHFWFSFNSFAPIGSDCEMVFVN